MIFGQKSYLNALDLLFLESYPGIYYDGCKSCGFVTHQYHFCDLSSQSQLKLLKSVACWEYLWLIRDLLSGRSCKSLKLNYLSQAITMSRKRSRLWPYDCRVGRPPALHATWLLGCHSLAADSSESCPQAEPRMVNHSMLFPFAPAGAAVIDCTGGRGKAIGWLR